MKIIDIKNQKEFDIAFEEISEGIIRIVSKAGSVIVVKAKKDGICVEARESSHVEAWGSSHVEAWGSSHVVAWGSSHVEAWESSHVEARGSSHVEARESSHVVAWESSHVEAWGSVAVWAKSEDSTIELGGQSVCFLKVECSLKIVSQSVLIQKNILDGGIKNWLTYNGVATNSSTVILYKRVSQKFLTQEDTSNETQWKINEEIVHPAWSPASQECGEGKFHACARPYICDQFRSNIDDRYIAIEVAIEDLYSWPNPEYPTKIAFRKGKVLYECDRFGKRRLSTKTHKKNNVEKSAATELIEQMEKEAGCRIEDHDGHNNAISGIIGLLAKRNINKAEQ